MTKIYRMLPYLFLTGLGFYLLPHVKMVNGMGLMLFALPVVVFSCALVFGLRNQFHWTYFIYPVMVAIIFIPTVLIYYNYTAYFYIVIFGVIALVGSFVGRLFVMRAP